VEITASADAVKLSTEVLFLFAQEFFDSYFIIIYLPATAG